MKVIFYFMLFFVACRPSHLGELAGVSKPKSLEETYWVLRELNGKPVSDNEDKKIYLQFGKVDKSLVGFAPCNRLTGTYAEDGKKITLTLASSKKICSGMMEVENAFFFAMSVANEYAIKQNELYLKSEGKTVARFIAEVKTMK